MLDCVVDFNELSRTSFLLDLPLFIGFWKDKYDELDAMMRYMLLLKTSVTMPEVATQTELNN